MLIAKTGLILEINLGTEISCSLGLNASCRYIDTETSLRHGDVADFGVGNGLGDIAVISAIRLACLR